MIVNKNNLHIEHFHNATIIESEKSSGVKRRLHFEYACKQAHIDGTIMEFGVFKGKTLLRLTQQFPTEQIYAFDSFEGLPEDWFMTRDELEKNLSKHPKGHFAGFQVQYDLPDTVNYVKGFFKDSIPKWLSENNLEQIKFLHIDGDLYSSAVDVLWNLNTYIVPGTIIVFDELYPWGNYDDYELWQEGEWKALVEWTNEFNRSFEVVSRNMHQQAAIKIVS